MTDPAHELRENDELFTASVTCFLTELGLVEEGEVLAFEPLAGGVSSDIWKVKAARGVYCVKQALPRLKVAALWEAPRERSHFEAEWLRVAAAIRPLNVPALIAEDVGRNLIVMEYLPPERYPLWKAQLRDGNASPSFASDVAATLAAIHAATADDCEMAARFATDENFHAIRLAPYLEATARACPLVAPQLQAMSLRTAQTKKCLVHGDVSPKNILAGPRGPVLLDAECAWYGDPAFDLAFLLNHLLLKCIWTPQAAPAFLTCFVMAARTYLEAVAWERPSALEVRAASLLPALMLARVDGTSPVEYITAEDDKALVRRFALRLLLKPMDEIAFIGEAWAREITA
jgi:aminoglycoside phosphotransferase (APT) family kinase protein